MQGREDGEDTRNVPAEAPVSTDTEGKDSSGASRVAVVVAVAIGGALKPVPAGTYDALSTGCPSATQRLYPRNTPFPTAS